MAYRNSLACILFLLGNLSLADDKSGIAEKHRLDIQELMQSITSAEYVGREPLRDLETLAKLPAVGDFLDSLATEFATEIKSGNQPYRNLEGTIGHARRRISEFEAALKNYASLSSLTEDVEHTRAMLAMAIENQAPAYFREGNDIANRRLAIDFKLSVIDKVASPQNLAKAKELSSQLARGVKAAPIDSRSRSLAATSCRWMVTGYSTENNYLSWWNPLGTRQHRREYRFTSASLAIHGADRCNGKYRIAHYTR